MKRYECELDKKKYSVRVYKEVFVPVDTVRGTQYVDTGKREEFEDWVEHMSEAELFELFKLAKAQGVTSSLGASLSNEVAYVEMTICRAEMQPKMSAQYPRYRWLPVKYVGEAVNRKGDRVGGIRFV